MLHIGGGGGGRKTKGPTAEFKNSVRYVLRNITAFTATSTFRRWKYKYTTTNNYEVLQLRHVVQLKTCGTKTGHVHTEAVFFFSRIQLTHPL